MGLGRALLADLLTLKRSGALDGYSRVVEIGSQQLTDDFLEADDLLDELYRLFGRSRPPIGVAVGQQNFTEQAPPSSPFWTSLGFEYATIDFDGHRDSTALDLNKDEVPAQLRERFHLVINAGTTEHVANQDNAFRVIHDLTARNGLMYHEVPAGAFGDHGLISYNPKFFNRLCYCNGYRTLLRKDEPCVIRTALIKRSRRPFATPLDLPEVLMPKPPFDVRSVLSQIPGSSAWPWIKRTLRNAGLS